MQEIITQNVDLILQNVKKKINGTNDNDLADFFGVKPGTISAWRKRNSLNYELLITKCRENTWNVYEIIYGDTTICSEIKKIPINQSMNQERMEDFFFKLIHEKDKENQKLAEEIGTLKEQIRALKKISGYQNPSLAAEP